ncbi:hypothetical protein B0H14DRAFT_3653243 [Mycena olivaceomarginata]|nr:hypothetical protein B0H14DRAFT_3653243 [Mycena olivaceomarginata]
MGNLLNEPKHKCLVCWMLVDEAHVLDEESETFRKPYRGILHMRPCLPSGTVWAAATGTATISAAFRIAVGLGFRSGQYFLTCSPSLEEHILRHSQLAALKQFCARNVGFLALIPNYLRKFIADIDGSVLHVRIVTDTCTYGTDIPALARVEATNGTPGRDGNPAVAIVYAPAWVRDLPESQITTKHGLADLERRQQLPAVTQQFFNQTPDLCARGADLKYNGKESVLRPSCCFLYDPEPESHDLAMVSERGQHFKQRDQLNAPKEKTIRSDGKYPALDSVLKQSLAIILVQWWARMYNTARPAQRMGSGSVFLLPERLLLRIVDRAHTCTSLDRLWGIMHDYFFKLLSEVLPRYAEILDARKEASDRMDVDPPLTVHVEAGGAARESSSIDVDPRPRSGAPHHPGKARFRMRKFLVTSGRLRVAFPPVMDYTAFSDNAWFSGSDKWILYHSRFCFVSATTNLGYLLKAYHELKFSQRQISSPPYAQKPWSEFREEYPEIPSAILIVCDIHSETNGK